MTNKVICPYCGKPGKLVTGRAIYPHRKDLYGSIFYRCLPCDAFVGCHSGTWVPLGSLANQELREARTRAHLLLDAMWECGVMLRSDAYGWLAEELGLEKSECHIGKFDLDMCKRAIKAIEGQDE